MFIRVIEGVSISINRQYPEYLIYILGGNSDEVPPLPIPNREVKLHSADGIAFSM